MRQDARVPFSPSIETKLNVWTLAAVLTALYGLYGIARGWWRASLGKRRRLIRAYRRMAPYVRHDYVTELFGEPAWEHKQTVRKYGGAIREDEPEAGLTDVELTVRTWPLGLLGYLVTWCNKHDEILMYSLTTRSRLFRPRISVGPYRITLGRTPLASLPTSDPDGTRPWHELGARRFSYAEQHYFGNPGGYLHWVVGVSDAGAPLAPPIGYDRDTWGGPRRWPRTGVWPASTPCSSSAPPSTWTACFPAASHRTSTPSGSSNFATPHASHWPPGTTPPGRRASGGRTETERATGRRRWRAHDQLIGRFRVL